MIELVNTLISQVKGKVGDHVICNRDDRLFLRKYSKSDKPRSKKQQVVINKFKAANMLYGAIRNPLFSLIWKKMVKKNSSNAVNNFISANHSIFNITEEIVDYSLLKVSVGNLGLPLEMSADFSGGKLIVKWKEEEDVYTGKDNDLFYCLLMHDDYTYTSYLFDNLNVKRGDLRAEIDLPDARELVHLYCFFGSFNGAEFSPSKYIRLN